MKEIVILGGPNGAGKTTAARKLLPRFFENNVFLNADDIARRMDPANVDRAAFAAGRELLWRMRELIAADHSFAFETTCSGKSYIPLLRECKLQGWTVSLLYFWLHSPQASIARVARRVRDGGHGIAEEAIYRRFRTGIWNLLNLYVPLADNAEIYDNTDGNRVLIASKQNGGAVLIQQIETWKKMQEASR